MKTIRSSIFETNSSSIHSIVVGNNGEDIYNHLPKEVHFQSGEFGWEHEIYRDIQDKANYLFTSIVYNGGYEDYDVQVYFDKIKNILAKWGIKATFEEIQVKYTDKGEKYVTFRSNLYGYVDHGYENRGLIASLCNNEELLMNYLFSDGSYVETGNDNDDTIFVAENPSNVLLEYEKGN